MCACCCVSIHIYVCEATPGAGQRVWRPGRATPDHRGGTHDPGAGQRACPPFRGTFSGLRDNSGVPVWRPSGWCTRPLRPSGTSPQAGRRPRDFCFGSGSRSSPTFGCAPPRWVEGSGGAHDPSALRAPPRKRGEGHGFPVSARDRDHLPRLGVPHRDGSARREPQVNERHVSSVTLRGFAFSRLEATVVATTDD